MNEATNRDFFTAVHGDQIPYICTGIYILRFFFHLSRTLDTVLGGFLDGLGSHLIRVDLMVPFCIEREFVCLRN